MTDLSSIAEVGHLRRELHVDDDALDFLAGLAIDDLRHLRRTVATSLGARHRSTFVGMAKAARLLPDKLLPPIAERAIGPLACSKIAAELEPAHARKIVGSFSVPFLADLCHTIDTHAATDQLRAISPSKAVPVGEELYRRAQLETLGRFIDVVDERAIPPMLDIIDEESLLRVAIVAESRERLSSIFGQLPDERILALVDAGIRAGLLDEALVVVAELEAEQLVRTIELIVDAGELVVTDVVAAIADLDAWNRLLPVIAGLDPAHVAKVASAPVISRPEVFESIVDHVIEAGAVDDFVALIGALDDDEQEQLARTVAETAPAVCRRLIEVADELGKGQELVALAVLRSAAAE